MTATLFYGKLFMTSFHDTITSQLQDKEATSQQEIGVLCVTGTDAKKFLQGQITCDINKLSISDSLYGAICSIKGRIISNFYLVQKDEDVLMLMSKDLVEKTLQHLKKYSVFFKTELTSNENFSVYAKLTESTLQTTQNTLPEKLTTSSDSHNVIKVTLCEYPIQIEWLITDTNNTLIKEQNTELSALSVLAARPLITLEQSENILPQWLNMQRTGGISFTKGCYTGQEIVARMQYKGKSKKQLALFQWTNFLDSTQAIVDQAEKNLGEVLSVTRLNDIYYAQAIVNTDPNEVESFLLDNHKITIIPLPYLLESNT